MTGIDELVLRSIADPGRFTPRGDNFEEPLVLWQRRALLAALSEHLRERGLLLGPDGLVKAEETTAAPDRSCFDCGADYETGHAPDCPDRCPHCGSEGWDNDHRDGCPTLGTCAQTDPWLDPPWHDDADYCQPFTSECWREHLARFHGIAALIPQDPTEEP